MQRPNQPLLRVNLTEQKAQLVKRLGPDRLKLYFYYLNKYLNLKLSKAEFNKFCLRVIGRENIRLHNQLIRSILKNACNAKVPPSSSTRDVNGFEFTSDGSQNSDDVLLSSPLGTRSGISVGSDGKVDFSSSQQLTITRNNIVSGNGDFDSHEMKNQVPNHQVISNDKNNGGEVGACHPTKTKGPAESVISVDTSEQGEVLVVRDVKELSSWSSLKAPLGIPLLPFSVDRAHETSYLANGGRCFSSSDIGELLDSETLKKRMLQIGAAHGIEGVSMECANLLNSWLNVYLKRLIRSSIELAGTRCGHDLMVNDDHNRHSYRMFVNDVLRNNHFHEQSSSSPSEKMTEQGGNLPLSLLDFKVAMWLKPQQLGENWPLLLEKICTHSHKE